MSLETIGDAWEKSDAIKSSTALLEESKGGKREVSADAYQAILARHDGKLEEIREVFIEKLNKAQQLLEEAADYERLVYSNNNEQDKEGPVVKATNTIHQLLQDLEK